MTFGPQDLRCSHLNSKEKGDLARGHPGDRLLGNLRLQEDSKINSSDWFCLDPFSDFSNLKSVFINSLTFLSGCWRPGCVPGAEDVMMAMRQALISGACFSSHPPTSSLPPKPNSTFIFCARTNDPLSACSVH